MDNRAFKAMIVTETEEKQFVRAIGERHVDDLPVGEVLIRVRYSSLNYKDALSASGNKGVTRRYPHTPGIDAAGIVAESSAPNVKPGDEVLVTGFDLGMNTSGGFAEYIRVPAAWVVPLPAGLSLRESMIYGTAGFTAALSCLRLIDNGVAAGHGPILVTGATGGVGSIAVAILAKCGYKVMAATTKGAETSYLRQIGANEVISSSEVDDQSGRPLLKPRWAGAVDTVGGNILSTAIKATRYGGTVTCCGNITSGELHTSIYPFILNGVSLLGIDSVNCPAPLRRRVWKRLSGEWKLDHLDTITTELPNLEALDERIGLILQGKNRGRAIVRIGD
ncbi:quinone oxidoreductase, YhdH/YhfP family [Desulfobulbus propionicus DSM 2032]|jgi:putative YhdH/YhfP family quinone oxidoreductase|uniref:Quinone oxidoreductase, YhdH/YhfP family n=1 Tax=Desulfobulbus propionicus (strain ATCC 33891 / DSM 2032 / VKM B-1956 / 1pr3) TaxID=577650 RepID=A0A7U4DPI7_DESPD|nr:YhdH/YhfP family quinone oxidoreductase [Desulfobulbus propionicus]ADW18181.1 quinone oxidoreductase, YhdH/YhfP family [Desulfobulbus propionicus DSM 2032]